MRRVHSVVINEPNVWKASDFGVGEPWVLNLNSEQIGVLESVMEDAMVQNIAPQDVNLKNIPIADLEVLLGLASQTLECGRGFVVLRGWPSRNYSKTQNLTVYCGIANYFGNVMIQNYEGEKIVDVIDKRKPYDQASRGYMSNKRLPFHSDGADLVGLLCLGESKEGGTSLLLSATNLYNTILSERPECLETLMCGFYHHRRGQHNPGESPVTTGRIPVFSFHNELLHCCYNRNPINWAINEGINLTERERETLDYFDDLCQRPDMAVEITFREGDMQFVNNFVILHSRTEYRDTPDRRRHLVRLWLENQNSRRGAQGLLDVYVPGSSKISHL